MRRLYMDTQKFQSIRSSPLILQLDIFLLDKLSIIRLMNTQCFVKKVSFRQGNTNHNIFQPSYSSPHYFHTRLPSFALYKSPRATSKIFVSNYQEKKII